MSEQEQDLTPEQIRELVQILEKIERLEMIVSELSKIIQEKIQKATGEQR